MPIKCPQASSFWPETLKSNRVDPSCRTRIAMERVIAAATIRAALKAGFTLSVFDGEEVTIKCSTNFEDILFSMCTTDEDFLYLNRGGGNGKRVGWIRFIYGNTGYDVISDYTLNVEKLFDMKSVQNLADSIEDTGEIPSYLQFGE